MVKKSVVKKVLKSDVNFSLEKKVKNYLGVNVDSSFDNIANDCNLVSKDDLIGLQIVLDKFVKDGSVVRILFSVSGAYHYNLSSKISKSYAIKNLFITASPKKPLFFKITQFFDRHF